MSSTASGALGARRWRVWCKVRSVVVLSNVADAGRLGQKVSKTTFRDRYRRSIQI
jgi:hypothetical protein